ncbi:hypothetical protein [Mycolicibacterium sphagni]|nr:hypothetical protein [Mycolicibacterium sphagni]
MSLETGATPFFEPDRLPHLKHGFRPSPPFGDYEFDPNSASCTLEL